MPYTRVHYRYTDASNYKYDATALLYGTVVEDDKRRVRATLDTVACDGMGFIPQQLGWPHPAAGDPSFPSTDDHCWSALDVDEEETFEAVSEPAPGEDVNDSVSGWVAAMTGYSRWGWDAERWAL